MISAILAPWSGGLDHNGLANNFNYETTFSLSYELPHTKLRHPVLYPYNPIFLAKDYPKTIGTP